MGGSSAAFKTGNCFFSLSTITSPFLIPSSVIYKSRNMTCISGMSHLEKNLKAFNALKQVLAGEVGRWALMRDEKLVETFSSSDDAHKYAGVAFKDRNYSVHQIANIKVDLGAFETHTIPSVFPYPNPPSYDVTGTPHFPPTVFYRNNTC